VPTVRDVYEVLTAFTAGMTVQDVCSQLHPRLLGIDERHVNPFKLSDVKWLHFKVFRATLV